MQCKVTIYVRFNQLEFYIFKILSFQIINNKSFLKFLQKNKKRDTWDLDAYCIKPSAGWLVVRGARRCGIPNNATCWLIVHHISFLPHKSPIPSIRSNSLLARFLGQEVVCPHFELLRRACVRVLELFRLPLHIVCIQWVH